MDERKRSLRAELRPGRFGRPGPGDAGALLAGLGSLPELAVAGTVAAYVAHGSEPPTGPLLEMLSVRGTTVLLPVLLPDADLDWTSYGGSVLIGPAAIASAQVVVVPALAVDRAGTRLGRGGGSYDRALARVERGVLVVALVYDHEYVEALPAAPHDRPVRAVVTPGRVVRLPA